MASCPHCGQPFPGAAPPSCPRCARPTRTAAPPAGGLDLKDVVPCARCGHEVYEDDLPADGACPRCKRSFFPDEPEEEDDDDEADGDRAAAPRRRRTAKGAAVARGRGRGGRRPGGAKKSSNPTPPAAKRSVTLPKEFKSAVISAFRRADAEAAQRLCLEFVGGNADHAKQIYSHLLGIAKTKGWLGVDAGAPGAPVEVVPTALPGPALGGHFGASPGGLAPGQPLEPLPLPAGILPGGPAPGQPLEPLPLPAGILPGGGHAPGPLPLPAGILPGAGAPPGDPLAPTVMLPGGAGAMDLEHSMEDMTAPGAPPLPAAPPVPSAAAAPGATGEAEPAESGFLARVALEGLAAQVSLLCRAGRHGAALQLAERAVARDPGSARALAALGEAQAGSGDEAAALQTLSNAVRADPGDPDVVRGYAQLLLRMSRFQEAIGAYQRLVGPGRGELKDAVALATALRKVGNAAGAQRVIEEVVKRDPQSLEPLRQEAEAKAAGGDLDGAARLLVQLLDRERPPFTLSRALADSLVGRLGASDLARLACAKVFRKVGLPFQAVRLLLPLVQGGLAAAAIVGDARRCLGLAYAALGAGAQAEEQLMAVVQQGGASAEEFRALGVIYLERGDTEKGVHALTKARDAAPDDVTTHRDLARALAAADDLEGAIRELRTAHERVGTDDAALEEELDRITERAFLRRVKALEARLLANEADAGARLELATAHAQRGDLPEAIAQLEWVAAHAPAELGRAVEAAQQIHDEAPDERALVLLLARLHTQAGDAPAAIEVLEGYLAEREDPEVTLLLLERYAAGERVQEADVGLRALLGSARRSDLPGAVALADGILSRERGFAGLALAAARAHRKLGEVDAAVAGFRRYLDSEPGDPDARGELARLLEGAGRAAEALEVLSPLVRDGAGSTAELERVAGLALQAGRLADAVTLLERAAARAPDDLGLRSALEATRSRLRRERIAGLQQSQQPDERLELAGLYAEEGRRDAALPLLEALGQLDPANRELSYLRFCAERFARSGLGDKAEAALRQGARGLGYAPGSEQHKEILARIGAMHERTGDRGAACRVYLELYAHDPRYRDVAARLEGLAADVAPTSAADAQLLDLVDVGAPLGTVFDSLQEFDLALDPALLAGSRTSTTLKAQRLLG